MINIEDIKIEEIKALAFDLDGTILAPGALLTDRTRLAIQRCAEKGLQIIIATGRSIESSERYRTALGVSGPMVYFNGAVVAERSSLNGGLIVHNTILLDAEVAEFCIDISRKMGIFLQIYFPPAEGENAWLLMAESDTVQREFYTKHTGIESQIGDLKKTIQEKYTHGCIKGMFLADPSELDLLRPKLEARFGSSVYLARTLATFLEILNAGASKGTGLATALEKRGIKKEQAIAFGDEENDLPMFSTAGYSVAPASAVPMVRAAADFVCPPNTEDGVASFLEKMFLRQ